MNISKTELSATIGTVIRDLRLAEKKTMETLSTEIDIGYSQLSRIERGKINTSIYQLYAILTALNVPMNTFLEILVLAIRKEKIKNKKKDANKKLYKNRFQPWFVSSPTKNDQ